MAWNLLQEFQALISAYAMRDPSPPLEGPADPSSSDGVHSHRAPGPPADAADWQLVVHEITTFMHADVAMPEPRSPGTFISFKPNLRCSGSGPMLSIAPHTRRLKEVVFVSYQSRQLKIAELPLDVFRIMQTLEWRDDTATASSSEDLATASTSTTGSHNPPSTSAPGENGGTGPASQPAPVYDNPSKQHFYRTTTPALMAVLGATLGNLTGNDIMLIYLNCHSASKAVAAATSASSASPASPLPPAKLAEGVLLCPYKGTAANQPIADLVLMPEDLLSLTRRRLLLATLDEMVIELGKTMLKALQSGATRSEWANAFDDLLLRQHLLRFLLCRTALHMHGSTYDDTACQPSCFPEMPVEVAATSQVCKDAVAKVVGVLGKEDLFKGMAGAVILRGSLASMSLDATDGADEAVLSLADGAAL
eukprot:gene5138-34945_t